MIELLYNETNVILGNGILYRFNVWNVSKVLNLLELYVKDDANVQQLVDHAKSLGLVKINVNAVSAAVNWLKANGFTFVKQKINLQTGVMYYTYEQNVTTTVVNQKPIVNIISVAPITLPVVTVNLVGSATDDNLPLNNVSYTWSIVSKPANSNVTFSNVAAAQTTATVNLAGTYVLRLSVSDGELSSTKDVTITVNPALPPPIENVKAGFTTKIANTLY